MNDTCPNCGSALVGDGYREVRQCDRLDLLGFHIEPDAGPVFCDGWAGEEPKPEAKWIKQVYENAT